MILVKRQATQLSHPEKMKVSELPAPLSRPYSEKIDAASAVQDQPQLSRTLLIIMSIACGLGIANVYYNQPLLGQIGRTFHASVQSVGAIPMLAQAGFAVGVLFLAPLGDVLERRKLILSMIWLIAIGQVGAALSPSLFWLQIFSFVVGVTCVISTLLLPFAVSLCRPRERGATVGTIASAMLIGVLASRTFSGAIGQEFGWRTTFAIAALLMAILVLTLKFLLPESRPGNSIGYGELIKSTFRLAIQYRELREATINGVLLFGALSAFWATLVLLIESPVYRYGTAVAGTFGIVGAAGAMFAPFVGKLADRLSPRFIVGLGTAGMAVGFLLLYVFGFHLWGLVLGVIVLDLAAQSATISNQTTVYSLPNEVHSRAYTIYRAAYSIGGAGGAWLGAYGWSLWGWAGVCGVALALIGTAGVLHLLAFQRKRAFRLADATA